MLAFVYHPIDGSRVVEQEEADSLIEAGGWFDCPKKASEYRCKVESDIKNERKAAKAQKKEQENERQ